ncbi:MAG: DEAD/DEAH box helicase, partial [Allobaculum sp.]|nr:DEAD/DEAH box helicase [Allobaculum sp.]
AEMEKPKPMDHLLIGDVGYGKTEVAMRCAFKAVCAGKQVAFLCPTTILSMQHYQTLQKRFESIGTKVALVNRFTPAKEMKRIQQGLKDGSIEIVVGTHRLFSKSLEFKDLGFLIIDEEQRFGVGHKEKIKEMKNSIDVLALSATPIPRTLQMSLIGVRTISQLNTPPAHRHPIQTYLMEEKGPVIEEIIQRELSRSGQVFFLHNRIEDIFITAADLQRKFPDVSIGVAHGRMSRTEIEDVMLDFAQGKYQILVCTTIIETGLDIANANTIIIENADRFGLAQLYQIRGRVGRREKLAYCYLMVPAQKQLSEASSKRLKSIKEFTQLGSGYKIAMRDLTIRGAGDMLGPKQAGFIDSVGLDMYLDMLSQAIAKKQASVLPTPQEEPEEKLTSLKTARIKMEGYIPKQFTSNDGDKLDLYQHIRTITSEKALLEYEKETTDLFGQIPKEVQALFDAKWLDLFASRSDIQTIEENDGIIRITLSDNWAKRVDGRKFFEGSSSLLSGTKSQFKNVNGLVQVSFEKKKNYLALLKKFEGLLDDPAYFKKGS